MKRIKVKLTGKGYAKDPFTVKLPTWQMDCKRDASGNPIWINEAEGTVEDSVDYVNKECYVLVPDDETKMVGHKVKLHQQKIRKKYKKYWSQFNAADVELEYD